MPIGALVLKPFFLFCLLLHQGNRQRRRSSLWFGLGRTSQDFGMCGLGKGFLSPVYLCQKEG